MTTRTILFAVGVVLVSGCGGGQLRRTPTVERDTPWFCQMNEARNDWECVRDAELARNPKPERLPTDDLPEPEFIDASIPLIAPTVSFETESPALSATGSDESSDIVTPAITTPVTAAGPDLLSLDPGAYAIQLIAVANAALADRFVTEHGIDDAITARLARDDELFYVVLLGIYDNYGDAQYVVDHRSENLAALEPWIRPLSSIQDGIRAAENLVATGE